MNEECCRSEPAGGVGRAEKNTLSGWFLILRRRLQRLQLMLPGLQATKFRKRSLDVLGAAWQSIYGGLCAELLQNPSFEDNLWNAGRSKRCQSAPDPFNPCQHGTKTSRAYAARN